MIRLVRYMSSRPEHYKIRKYLLENKEQKCIICQKNHPPYLLECAHIKPRALADSVEKNDYAIVNWMCRNCHKIYDKGDISVKDGILIKNEYIEEFDFISNFKTEEYEKSSKYYEFHYKNVFK